MKTAISPLYLILIALGGISCSNDFDVPLKITSEQDPALSSDHNPAYLQTVFGEKFVVKGAFTGPGKDLKECNTWNMNRVSNPAVIHGSYEKGFPVGDWNFVMADAARIKLRWNKYQNTQTTSSFSVPFAVDETQVDADFYKLNASSQILGDVSIIISVRRGYFSKQQLQGLAHDVDYGLAEQGYRFRKQTDIIMQMDRTYLLSQYILTDSSLQSGVLYNIRGLCQSGKNFVEISFFHSAANEDLARLIFSMITMNFYVAGDRFYNPHLLLPAPGNQCNN